MQMIRHRLVSDVISVDSLDVYLIYYRPLPNVLADFVKRDLFIDNYALIYQWMYLYHFWYTCPEAKFQLTAIIVIYRPSFGVEISKPSKMEVLKRQEQFWSVILMDRKCSVRL